DRVKHALRRTRYFVAFDGLETYVWSGTTHHGVTHAVVEDGRSRLRGLSVFLKMLVKEKIGESRIAVGVDHLKARYDESESIRDLFGLGNCIEELKKSGFNRISADGNSSAGEFDRVFVDVGQGGLLKTLSSSPDREDLAVALFTLAAF